MKTKRRNRVAMASMRGLAIVYPHDGDALELRSRHGRRVQATEAHWHAVDCMQHVWWVGLMLQTKSGFEVEIFCPQAGRQCRHAQIADDVKAKHSELVAQHEEELISTGWVASIAELEVEDVLAFQGIATDFLKESA